MEQKVSTKHVAANGAAWWRRTTITTAKNLRPSMNGLRPIKPGHCQVDQDCVCLCVSATMIGAEQCVGFRSFPPAHTPYTFLFIDVPTVQIGTISWRGVDPGC